MQNDLKDILVMPSARKTHSVLLLRQQLVESSGTVTTFTNIDKSATNPEDTREVCTGLAMHGKVMSSAAMVFP